MQLKVSIEIIMEKDKNKKAAYTLENDLSKTKKTKEIIEKMVDALNDKRIKPGMNILVATFGAGLTCGAGIIKWGDRVESISESSKSIPDYDGSIFDLMKDRFNHYGINASHLLTP